MIESFFITVNEWMAGGAAIALLGCLLWGMISVLFSPCHLASIPLVVADVGGQQRALVQRQAAGCAAAFSTGLFITIAVIGAICSLLGRWVENSARQGAGSWFRRMAGAFICLLGVYFILNPIIGGLPS